MKNDLFSLSGKVALVFGGNGHLGTKFCGALLTQGARVYSCDLNDTETEETKSFKKEFDGAFELVKVDATKKEALEKLREHILKKEKTINILVNATTMKGNDFYLPFEEVSLEGWNTGLLGDLTIPFLTIQTFVPVMKKQKSGSIINIGSIYGLVGNDQRIYEGSNLHEVYTKEAPDIKRVYAHGVYNATKGGIINFTRYLAAYYGANNVRVNCISPGGVQHASENATFVKKYSEKVPLGRKAKEDEMNGALVFLASDASSYVTGQNVVVDGGYTAW